MSDWGYVDLGVISKISYGYTAKADLEIKGPKFLRITDIQDGKVDWETVPSCEISDEDYKKHKLQSNDIVFARTGATTGKSFRLDDIDEAVAASYLIRVRLTDTNILPEFVHYFFNTPEYWEKVNLGTTGSAQGGFNASKLASLSLPKPPISEQKRIVEVLDGAFEGIDAAIANTEKNLANTSELFGNYIEAIFSSDDKNWTNCLIGEVCTLKSGTTVPVEIEKSDGDIPYVKVAEMTMEENLDGIYTSIRFLNYADIKKNWIIPKGATIFPKRGGAILTNKKRMLLRDICLDLNIMAVIPSDRIIPEFLYIYFLNVDMRKLGNGSSIPQINNVDIAPLKFAFPSNKDEQLKVIEEFKVIEEGYNLLLKSYEHKLNLLSELKQSILQKAFRGELTRSSDALAEVAA